jgi:hypothetical protein
MTEQTMITNQLSNQFNQAGVASIGFVRQELEVLPDGIKRMLRMQTREFVHYIEDAEDGFACGSAVIRPGPFVSERAA